MNIIEKRVICLLNFKVFGFYLICKLHAVNACYFKKKSKLLNYYQFLTELLKNNDVKNLKIRKLHTKKNVLLGIS